MCCFLHPKKNVKKCEFCEDFGMIYIWRSDLEDFDLIPCPECNEKED